MEREGIEQSSDELLTVELLWNSLSVGDKIELEADLSISGSVLFAGQFYEIIGKYGREQGAPYDAFYVQSDETNELVPVSPAFVANYQISSSHQSH